MILLILMIVSTIAFVGIALWNMKSGGEHKVLMYSVLAVEIALTMLYAVLNF